MIFSHTLDLVLKGWKVQTRRVKKPHEALINNGGLRRVEAKTARSHRVVYQIGKTYALQPGRAQKAVAYIVLRAIREEAVEDISDADAHAEGYDSREEFFAAWYTIHGAKANLQQRVWVLTFEVLPIYNKATEDDPTIGSATPARSDPSRRQSLRIPRRSHLSVEGIDAAIHRKILTAKDSESPETE